MTDPEELPDLDDEGAPTSGRGRRRDPAPETRLSRLLAYVLRHRPDAIEVHPDSQGWVRVAELVEAITAHRRLGFPVDEAFLERVVESDPRRRFEIDRTADEEGPRSIRARYGHTFAGTRTAGEALNPANLPEFLFVAATRSELQRVLGGSRVTPITEDVDSSVELVPSHGRALKLAQAKARDTEDEPCVLVIDAARAARAGEAMFCRGDGDSYLAPSVPRSYVFNARRGFREQHSAGGVVVRGEGDQAEVLLIATSRSRGARSAAGRRTRGRERWELPKGKINPGEDPTDTAVREIREETGITANLKLGPFVGEIYYGFRVPEGVPIFKTVYYWVVRCLDDGDDALLRPARDEGLVAVEWVPAHQAIARVAYGNLRPIVERACEILDLG